MPAKQSLSLALEPRAALSFDDFVADCAWSADGKFLAVAGGEGKVGLATVVGDFALRTIGEHLLGTLAVAWQPRAQRFATSGQDGAIALWDAATASQLKRWKPARGRDAGAGVFARRRTARQRRRQGGVPVVSGRRETACFCAGGQHRGGAGLRSARNRYRGRPEW